MVRKFEFVTEAVIGLHGIKKDRLYHSGRFIMFSVITNIYNKKTKGPTSMEVFTSTRNLKKSILTTRDFGCVHNG